MAVKPLGVEPRGSRVQPRKSPARKLRIQDRAVSVEIQVVRSTSNLYWQLIGSVVFHLPRSPMPLIKEYALNDMGIPTMIQGIVPKKGEMAGSLNLFAAILSS